MFMLYFFEIPKGVLEKIESFRSHFFWQNDQHKKYMLVKRKLICQPKTQGGLGVQDLEIQNKYLLSKWLLSCVMKMGCGKNCCVTNMSQIEP